MKQSYKGYFWNDEGPGCPAKFNDITKIEGPNERHIEQLWDEVKKLKERLSKMEKLK